MLSLSTDKNALDYILHNVCMPLSLLLESIPYEMYDRGSLVYEYYRDSRTFSISYNQQKIVIYLLSYVLS